mmetsp:Transcript_14349/g.43153  ORF Transcript_14349/g.43153 Transcript_14349/m.43153 type:complete len:259 (-) Transcript_14349:82-858(-)
MVDRPIEVLPNLSQIEPEVLDELPLVLRREIKYNLEQRTKEKMKTQKQQQPKKPKQTKLNPTDTQQPVSTAGSTTTTTAFVSESSTSPVSRPSGRNPLALLDARHTSPKQSTASTNHQRGRGQRSKANNKRLRTQKGRQLRVFQPLTQPLLAPAAIDAEVFAALPDHVQEDYIREFEIQQQRVENKRKRAHELVTGTETSANPSSSAVSQFPAFSASPPTSALFYRVESFDRIRSALITWLYSDHLCLDSSHLQLLFQ